MPVNYTACISLLQDTCTHTHICVCIWMASYLPPLPLRFPSLMLSSSHAWLLRYNSCSVQTRQRGHAEHWQMRQPIKPGAATRVTANDTHPLSLSHSRVCVCVDACMGLCVWMCGWVQVCVCAYGCESSINLSKCLWVERGEGLFLF